MKQPKPLTQLNEEYAQAKLAKQQMDQAVQSVFTTISKTGTVNPQQAAEAVQEITIAMRTLTDSAIFMALSQNRAGDSTLSRHALATCTLSLVIGQAFQFNPLELHELATAALLHDIGLLQIRPAVVRHTHAASDLSKADQQEFETHPRRAVLMLERQGGIEAAILHLIANHHAYLDDSGYPKESRGQFTSDRTRILMVVDRYDELITGFGRTSPLTPHQTFQRLYQEAQQGKLDQRIVSSFIARVGIYPVHSHVRLNTQELAVVTELHQEKLHQPIVTITHQPGGTEYPAPFVVDLAHQTGDPQVRAIETIIAMDT
jgi:HD-GYP domain-containing protein (c-di-GMP phosphodiesterase class II)